MGFRRSVETPQLVGKERPTASYLTVQVNDVPATRAALMHAGARAASPIQQSGTARYFTVQDPNGNVVEFLKP